MTVRPIIFISAVSKELRSARQLVANTLQLLGYEPDWQEIFGTEQGDLRGMLRRKVDASAGVVQLIGQCYGAEPPTPDEQFRRVSYSQYEALYAKQRGKKVWYLILDPDFTTDPHDAESQELRALQIAYQQKVREGGQLYHPLASSEALENKVLKLRDDLAQLRKRGKQWATAVLALLIVLVATIAWMVRDQHQQDKAIQTQGQQVSAVLEHNKKMKEALVRLAVVEAQAKQPEEKLTPDEQRDRAYAILEKELGLATGTLAKELPGFALELYSRAETTPLMRARAAYALNKFGEAEKLSAEAAEQDQKAYETANRVAEERRKKALDEFVLAGQSAQKRFHYADSLHYLRNAEQLTDRNREPAEWANVQDDLAWVRDDEGLYSEEQAILRDVIATREKVLGPEHPDTLRSRGNFATALDSQGKYGEAEAEYRTVIKLMEKVLGPEHPITLASRGGLAFTFGHEGRFAEARAEVRAVLQLEEKVLGPEHPITLASRSSVANELLLEGKYAEADAEHRAVLKLREKVLGPEHPGTLQSRSNLALLLDSQGKYAEAEAEYGAVIKLMEKVLGPENPRTLRIRCALTVALFGQGRYADAEAECRAVLNLQEKVLGPEHPDTLATRVNLAGCLYAQGKYYEAENELEVSLTLQEKTLGSTHPSIANSRFILADVLFAQRKYPEAETQSRAALPVIAKAFGPDHPHTLRCRVQLADALSSQRKFTEAEAEYRVALEKLQDLQPNDTETMRALYNFAATLGNEGKLSEALLTARGVEQKRKKALGEAHPDYKASRALGEKLEAALKEQADRNEASGKYAEAEAEYRALLKDQEQALGPEYPNTLESRNALAWLLATCPDDKIRNGREAVELATKLCELSHWGNGSYLDTLAAAEAEAGLFDSAVKHQHQAIDLAKGATEDVKDLETHLSLYTNHNPYRSQQQ